MGKSWGFLWINEPMCMGFTAVTKRSGMMGKKTKGTKVVPSKTRTDLERHGTWKCHQKESPVIPALGETIIKLGEPSVKNIGVWNF